MNETDLLVNSRLKIPIKIKAAEKNCYHSKTFRTSIISIIINKRVSFRLLAIFSLAAWALLFPIAEKVIKNAMIFIYLS